MKKSNLMKIVSLTVMIAFIGSVSMNAQGGKANFSGNWTYSAEKSTPPPAAATGGGGGGQRMGGGGNMVVKHAGNDLSIDRTRNGQDGTPVTTTTKYTLDGKEVVTTTQRGESKATATWSADGKSVSIVTKQVFGERTMESTAVWSLVDAKTLSVKTSRPGQDGAMTTTTAVYEIK